MTTTPVHAFVHLRSEGVSVLLDCTRGRLPALAHWGADLGRVSAEDVASLVHAHPTQNEALGEAFLALAGKPLHAHN